jgi:hypothetical protein
MVKRKISDYEKETTREITFMGEKTRVRRVPPSQEAIESLGEHHRKHTIIGHLAVNPREIEKEIRTLKSNILREMAAMSREQRDDFMNKGPIDFVKDKGNRKKYDILCGRCGEKVAYCWAENEKLDNWCDLHYICWFDKDSWRGALAVNVSPIDGHLGFECACGEDTRDHRANKTLAPIAKQLMVEYVMKHRDFAKPSSRFAAMAQ